MQTKVAHRQIDKEAMFDFLMLLIQTGVKFGTAKQLGSTQVLYVNTVQSSPFSMSSSSVNNGEVWVMGLGTSVVEGATIDLSIVSSDIAIIGPYPDFTAIMQACFTFRLMTATFDAVAPPTNFTLDNPVAKGAVFIRAFERDGDFQLDAANITNLTGTSLPFGISGNYQAANALQGGVNTALRSWSYMSSYWPAITGGCAQAGTLTVFMGFPYGGASLTCNVIIAEPRPWITTL